MQRKLCFLLALIMAISIFAGCEKIPEETSEETPEPTAEVTPEPTEEPVVTKEPEPTEEPTIPPEEKYKDNEAYKTAMQFINYLKEGDLAQVASCIALYNNSVIEKNHLEDVIRESKWSALIDNKATPKFISFDQRYDDKKLLSLNISGKQWDIPLSLDYDGVWRVSFSEYIVENFQFVVPWEVEVYWDGKLLDRNRHRVTINTGSTLLDLYTVTCTPTEVEFKFISDAYGEFYRKITPKYVEEPYELDRHFSEEQANELLQGVQDMWNDMFNDYFKNMTIEEWTYKHFGYKTTDEEELAVYNQIKDQVEANNYKSIKMIDIVRWDDNYIGISTNRGATVNFSYRIQMEKAKSDGSSETIYTDTLHSHAKVEKAQGGYYIILELTDPDLFKGLEAPKGDDIELDDYSEVNSEEIADLTHIEDTESEIPSPEEQVSTSEAS